MQSNERSAATVEGRELDEQEIIDRIVQKIREEYKPHKIILFGSRIWGSPRPYSDLDMLVIKDSEKREIERIRDIARLVRGFRERPYRMPIDIIVKTPAEVQHRLDIGDSFMRDILQRGETVYERRRV